MLTGHWLRCDRTLAQSLVSSFDQGEVVWLRLDAEEKSDRTLGAGVRSTPVRFQRAVFVTGHRSESGHNLTALWRRELTGASSHPVKAHNGSF